MIGCYIAFVSIPEISNMRGRQFLRSKMWLKLEMGAPKWHELNWDLPHQTLIRRVKIQFNVYQFSMNWILVGYFEMIFPLSFDHKIYLFHEYLIDEQIWNKNLKWLFRFLFIIYIKCSFIGSFSPIKYTYSLMTKPRWKQPNRTEK